MKNNDNGNKEKINIMTLGRFDVGKTCFIIRFTQNTFKDTIITTGIDLITTNIKLNNEKAYQVNIYDTAGQEKYKSMSTNTIKSADGILLMYDITNQKSFDLIDEWMKSIHEIKGDNFPIILIGNKTDLNDLRVISKEEGEELSLKYKLKFFETSNKDGTNIKDAALALINLIIEKQEKEKNELLKDYETKKLDKNVIKKKKIHNCPC